MIARLPNRRVTAALTCLVVLGAAAAFGPSQRETTKPRPLTSAPLFANNAPSFVNTDVPPSTPVGAPRSTSLLTRTIPAAGTVRLCQALGPAAPYAISSVDSLAGAGCTEVGWDARGQNPWQTYAQGEYVGAARSAHVPEYRLRVDDQLAIYYLRTRQVQSRAYRLQVGDRVRVESLIAASETSNAGADPESGGAADALDREVVVQPDGMISLPLIHTIPAAGRTISALQQGLEEAFEEFYRVPAITVTPIEINTRLVDLLDAVDNRGGNLGGRQIQVQVTPAGRAQLPGLGSVYVQGLTLTEVKREIDARYNSLTPGISVTVDLVQRAPRFLYVLGEVDQPGQFVLTGPTTVMQAIALAGGWNIGANLRQVVVFRRGEDWRLLATMVDVRGALNGRRPVPADEIWLADSDIVLVPKTPIQIVDEVIEQFFTRGLYAAIPIERIWGVDFNTVSAITSAN